MASDLKLDALAQARIGATRRRLEALGVDPARLEVMERHTQAPTVRFELEAFDPSAALEARDPTGRPPAADAARLRPARPAFRITPRG